MQFNVSDNSIETVSAERLVAGSVRIFTAEFRFDGSWDGYAKTAVFRAVERSVSVHLVAQVRLVGRHAVDKGKQAAMLPQQPKMVGENGQPLAQGMLIRRLGRGKAGGFDRAERGKVGRACVCDGHLGVRSLS